MSKKISYQVYKNCTPFLGAPETEGDEVAEPWPNIFSGFNVVKHDYI